MNPRPITSPLPAGLSRRTVLGATVAGAAGVLTACGGGDDDTSTAGGGKSKSAESSSAPESSAPESSAAGGAALAKTADVPVGGGVIVKDQKVVVTQPTAGEFKGFTAVCTHMGCLVGTVKGGTISCPCHGSQYSAVDGSVKGGPAPRPLAPVEVKVEGDSIVKA